VHDGDRTTAPPQPAAGQAADAGPQTAGGTAAPLARSAPLRVRIPAAGVDAPLVPLALDAAGTLVPPPPDRPGEAGWYAGGVTPGQRGTAIVAGHVDTVQGPAVFYTLGALRKGRTVSIDRTDGGTAVFTVDSVEVFAKSAFPDRRVYAAASRPELRLITCGGAYHDGTGYTGNVVVFAHLTGETSPQHGG
jgi:hypothetical protein